MNNYQDKWSRYHHKPTDGSNPSSGNGWIYTAYAVKVGCGVDRPNLITCWELCSVNGVFIRNPESETSPFSRDELLGVAALGLLKSNQLNSWNFSPYPIPPFSLSKLISQSRQLFTVQPYYKRILGLEVKLYHFAQTHRNTFWQKGLDQIYRFAFSTPMQDRYSILKWAGRFKAYRPDHLFYLGVSLIDRIGSPSGMRYLKYGGNKNMKAMVKEFTADHPLRK